MLKSVEPAGDGASSDWRSGPFLIVTRHDYRTDRRVHLHYYADELRAHGKVHFFSAGFSQLSRLNMDTRVPLWNRSNRVENVDGVDCFLWRTPTHPFNPRLGVLDPLAETLFAYYGRHAPQQLVDWAKKCRFIIIESGLPIVLFRAVKRANPTARIAYYASDDLTAIGCAPALKNELARTIESYDAVFALSRTLAARFSAKAPAYYLPYGVEPNDFDASTPSPYEGGINAVTVGSTLFDPTFFQLAAAEFPDITFHLIGCGQKAAGLKQHNVRIYGEMPFRTVMNYFRHADFGIAPYDVRKLDPHFAESSQKLTYMGILGLPAVCPDGAVGTYSGRYGYVAGDRASIADAVRAALAAGHFAEQPALSWAAVTDRLLAPEDYRDTRV